MTTIQKFEDLECWQEARKETNFIYKYLKDCRDFSFRDQIQRASVSVMNNIAEWFARTTAKDRIQFFMVATSSLSEVRSMIYLWQDIWYFSKEQSEILFGQNLHTSQVTYGFLRYLNTLK
jgi:four helix bundle protein